MQKILDFIKEYTGFSHALQQNIFTSIIIIFPQFRYRWQKYSAYVSAIIGILLVSRVWFEGIQSLATYFGLLSAGLAIALKDLVSSFAGWLFIIWRSPISVGERIQVGDYKGDVIDVRLFKFTLLEIGNWVDADQSTGRIIHVPNSMILTDTLANYTKGFQFIWNEIPILITFESNWKKAKKILGEIASKHAEHISKEAEHRIKHASKKFMIFYTQLTPTVYTSVKDSGVMLTIRYLISPKTRRGSEQSIWEEILTRFSECKDIDFAYPTQRFYDNSVEGKEEARAEKYSKTD
ncbi:MAG: mechanosensitive ion channel [Calditrichaceae bacterium]